MAQNIGCSQAKSIAVWLVLLLQSTPEQKTRSSTTSIFTTRGSRMKKKRQVYPAGMPRIKIELGLHLAPLLQKAFFFLQGLEFNR